MDAPNGLRRRAWEERNGRALYEHDEAVVVEEMAGVNGNSVPPELLPEQPAPEQPLVTTGGGSVVDVGVEVKQEGAGVATAGAMPEDLFLLKVAELKGMLKVIVVAWVRTVLYCAASVMNQY